MARINKFLNFSQKNPLHTKNGLRLLIPLICVSWVIQILNKIAFWCSNVGLFAMCILRKSTYFGKCVTKTRKNLQMLYRFAIFACDFEKPNRRGLNLTLGYYSDIDV